MNIAEILLLKYPGIDLIFNTVVQDNNDGNGQYIAKWGLDEPKPTIAELEQWYINNQNQIALGTLQAEFEQGLSAFIDQTVKIKGYDNRVSCASYAASTNELWAAEAAAFISWRDAIWSYAETQLQLFSTGEREITTFENFLLELPELNW